MNKYIVRAWIPIYSEEEGYDTLEEAQSELEQQELLSPENIYRIIETEKNAEIIIN